MGRLPLFWSRETERRALGYSTLPELLKHLRGSLGIPQGYFYICELQENGRGRPWEYRRAIFIYANSRRMVGDGLGNTAGLFLYM